MGRSRIIAILILSSFADFAQADLAKQHLSFDRLVVPGGRSAMLGGAYTALSDDPSGLFFNPAGIAQGDQNQVQLSSWSSNRSEVSYKEAVRGEDFTERSKNLVGSFGGGILHKKWVSFGYVVATLDKRNINQNDYFYDMSSVEGEARDFTRIHQESNSYDIGGLSIAFALGKAWSIGAAAFIYQREIEAMDYQQVQFNGGSVLVQELKIQVKNQGFHGSGGVLYHGEDLSVGLSLRVGDPIINKGKLTFNSVRHAVANTTPEVNNDQPDDYDSDQEIIPNLYRFGVAWHPASGILVSADASYSAFTPVSNNSPDRQATWNYALGVETGFASWRLMASVFTNNSIFPELNTAQANQSAHLNYLGKSIGTSIITKNFDLNLGYIRQEGEGKAQIIANTTESQKIQATMETVLLSLTFKL